MGYFSKDKGSTTTPNKVSTKTTTTDAIKGIGAAVVAAVETAKSTQNKKSNAVKKATGATDTSNATAVSDVSPDDSCLLQWGNISFYVKPTEIKSFKGLQIKSSTSTEVEENSEEAYVTKKKDGAVEMTLTAIVDMRLGESDVMAYAMELCEMCRTGASSYVYAKGKKLITCGMMGTGATIDKVEMTPDGTWISCEIKLTMKQCEKAGGGTSAPANTTNASSGKKSSGKKTVLQTVGGQVKDAKGISLSSGSGSGWGSQLTSALKVSSTKK